MSVGADRFNHDLELEEDEKADFKIKAKQFVKIYGQMAAIMPYELLDWEKLFWFLKFLIPKLIISESGGDVIDALLDSVDLSTYGLERTQLNHAIGLDESSAELDPQNPNSRGTHGSEEEHDPLDEIIKAFNERWFHGWEATPQDRRVKLISLMNNIKAHPDYQSKVADNRDMQNREIALKKIMDNVMRRQRKKELDLYKLYAKDDSFYQAFFDTMKRMIDTPSSAQASF